MRAARTTSAPAPLTRCARRAAGALTQRILDAGASVAAVEPDPEESETKGGSQVEAPSTCPGENVAGIV